MIVSWGRRDVEGDYGGFIPPLYAAELRIEATSKSYVQLRVMMQFIRLLSCSKSKYTAPYNTCNTQCASGVQYAGRPLRCVVTCCGLSSKMHSYFNEGEAMLQEAMFASTV